MKSNWRTAKLENCLEKVVYTSKIQRKDFLEYGKFPIVSQEEDFINGYWNNKQDLFKVNTPLVVFGDHTQVLKYVDFDFVLGADGVKILQPRKFLDPKYFYYYLQNIDLRSLGYARHYRLLKEKEIAYPATLPEQHHIVKILDEVFEGIAKAKENAEKNLKNARELFVSYLQSVFANTGYGWKEKTVGEIAQCSLGKMLDKDKNRGEPKKYLRNLNVRWFEFNLDDLLQMRFTPEEQEKYTAVRGDVLICEGGYPGRAAIWNEDYPIYFQKALHRVRFGVPDHSKWFLYYLYLQGKNGDLKKYFSGTGIQHFTGEALHRFVLPVAPIEQVRYIVSKLDALSAETKKLESIYQQKLDDLEELKKTILDKTFKGELQTWQI